ncbi:MAG TPA: heat-inducible transcription repressor HrcA [Hungateiclostridium thermocellum]|mgnify:CR=1 FL=1|jgi:heat-inducible transcriptional repressor|uniref:Heat-inducible transcription repressor HrcA n=2 Tax=Acetivibrio thermocellus TaxID=1515 RepID=HRCA_ACET2|nr:heat-inducible transcriptional repressor HrcA [Acetivibrio thermocellus]A3DF27.1 RecName: Full=Heat-inducible transcription repressor HrcA [Acetivibrio thermocellus ATCC 27405]CDG35997.1 Heat-inducible transcription repressor HrcA [Acetivibrio thermocellus BC1]ABN52556.1 heat-inducible transcription repressor HrcA [Acetivibrio thermocellus ATCC 27405]ADU73999.1 heat-inducible transcription repressor HrcA [Acetivibrio thermocellus DSM 1313]ALX07937.1 heat-inducible transcription repressor Hr
MFLDERKKRILQSIIDDYISTAEPVGSRTVARKHELGLSSATIRNEMADLEEMGYLTQPHTSAGRIPSDKGYRFYVDQLMKQSELTMEEIYSIKSAMDTKINELSQLLKQVSVAMSKITKYASMAALPEKKNSVLKAVQVVPVEKGKALVVVITNSGTIKNSLINISETVLPEHLVYVSNIFNEKLSGLTIGQINMPVIREIELLMGPSQDILMPVLNGVTDCIEQIDKSEVFLEGAINMLNYPEFSNVERAREFLKLMVEKDLISRVLKDANSEKDKIVIKIGHENDIEEMKECSLITTTYTAGDVVIGTIGIIGPTRMEYSKVLAAINYMKSKMKEHVERLIGKDLSGK